MNMETMRYSQEETFEHCENIKINHSINIDSCVSSIGEAYSSEGGKLDFTKSNPIINLDCIERILIKKHKRPGKKTMDIMFIVHNDTQKSIIVADFKLNTPHNSKLKSIKKSSIDNKISNSESAFSFGTPLTKEKYLIFRKEAVNAAISKINRQHNNRKHNIVPTDIITFYNLFFA